MNPRSSLFFTNLAIPTWTDLDTVLCVCLMLVEWCRYSANFETLKKGMADLGFHPYLDEDAQGVIITTFLFPDDKNFDFTRFYQELSDRGLVIYPGKLTKADCFRLGTIGRLFPHDIQGLVGAVKEVLEGMNVSLPVTQQHTESDSVLTG